MSKSTQQETSGGVPHDQQSQDEQSISSGTLVARSAFGGFLMGLANLVPGISGGTMLLAAGIYPAFIDALADVTRFRFRYRSLLTLACVVLSAGLGILFLAGTLNWLVIHYRWVMNSLFIGLTLGGLPLVWRLARPASAGLVIAAIVSFLMMVVLAVIKYNGVVGGGQENVVMFGLGGLAGASAMILPGLSGSYLLLLMGLYLPITGAIDQFMDALLARDFAAAMQPMFGVLVPVGVGVVAGVIIVGNAIKWALKSIPKITFGFLIGLLAGSTIGLWPFQVGVKPAIGDKIKGEIVTAETLEEIEPKDWSTEVFTPTATQILSSIGLIGLGFAVTMAVASVGGKNDDAIVPGSD